MNLEPKRIAIVAQVSAFLFAAALAAAPALSQTITGVPGSPSATIKIATD